MARIPFGSKVGLQLVMEQIELSGASSAYDIGLAFSGDIEAVDARDQKILELEERVNSGDLGMGQLMEMNGNALAQLQEQMTMLRETQQVLMEKLGVNGTTSSDQGDYSREGQSTPAGQAPSVMPASA